MSCRYCYQEEKIECFKCKKENCINCSKSVKEKSYCRTCQPSTEAFLGFGKYSTTKINKIPIGYLFWAQNSDSLSSQQRSIAWNEVKRRKKKRKP